MRQTEDSKIIYQYRSLEVFEKILEKKKIRLSDHNSFNDFMEVRWAYPNVLTELVKLYKENPFTIKGKSGKTLNFETIAKKAFSYMSERPEDGVIFCACFSEEDDLLSQWRAYGNDGRGVAIGFDFNLLEKECDPCFDFKPYKLNSITYINAEEKIASSEITKWLNNCLDHIKSSMEKYKDDDGSPTIERLAQMFIWSFLHTAMTEFIFYKNDFFKEEKEWRLIVNKKYSKTTYYTKDDKGSWKIRGMNDKFDYDFDESPEIVVESKNDRVVYYKEFDFSKLIDKGFIRKIVIGPSAFLKREDIMQLCIKHGIPPEKLEIEISKGTYRSVH
ncbi:MAG: DUF2971 domain-containing protein [Firmicutes bacterium]|nr:DUF2971 domain-containing protein [Bacillota bacterium]